MARRLRGRGVGPERVMLGEIVEGDRAGHEHAGGDERRSALEQQARASGGPELRDSRRCRLAGSDGPRRPDGDRRRRHGGCGGPERRSGAVHELADGAVGEAEVVGDLSAAVAADRRAQQRLALVARQRRHTGEGLAHHGASLEVRLRAARRTQRLGELVVVVACPLERVQRRVLGDPVEPGPQVAHLRALLQRGPRLQEGLLERVLGPGLREHPADVTVQRLPVALHDRLERALVTLPHQHDEARIGLRAQQGRGKNRGHGSGIGSRAGGDQAASTGYDERQDPWSRPDSTSVPDSTAVRTRGTSSSLRSSSTGV